MTVFDALALSQGVRRGEVQLLSKVVYHRQQNTVSLRWQPLTGESPSVCLARCRLRLKRALQARLKAMEESPLDVIPGGIRAILRKIRAICAAVGGSPIGRRPEASIRKKGGHIRAVFWFADKVKLWNIIL